MYSFWYMRGFIFFLKEKGQGNLLIENMVQKLRAQIKHIIFFHNET